MANADTSAALGYFETQRERFLDDLKTLARIPSISFPGFPAEKVRESAAAVAAQMKEAGLENVQVIDLGPGIHPYVYGDWLHAEGAPTTLLYAHHDVQPIGDEAKWDSPPFEPTERGGRLYGRGTADDKAGVSVHLAAISSYLKTSGKLPLNVKVLIEGEEEIGSSHLEQFVRTYRQKLACDAMVLTDTGNFDTGIPSLTVSLRGLVSVDVEVRALGHSLHSGMWGGPVPDPAMALCKMLSSLTDEEGRLALPEMLKEVRPVTPVERKAMGELPYDEADFRKQTTLLDGVPVRPGLSGKFEPFVQMWREPSLSVNAMEASNRAQAANIITASAWARVGIRIVADMDPDKVLAELTACLRERTPWGLEVRVTPEGSGKAWSTKADGPAFAAAVKALEEGYGRKMVFMGCGGTIPFVGPLSTELGGVPALLMGVEDPYTNPHSENESLHLGDWEKAIRAAILFYEYYGSRKS